MGMFFGRRGRRGLSPLMTILLGALAYRSLTKGKGRLATLIGGLGRSGQLGALLSTILQQVMQGMRNGDETTHRSPSDGHDVEEALGEARIRWLMAETGMTREELIAGLRRFS
jgi:uncharacterized protein YidB (DUF937 family)